MARLRTPKAVIAVPAPASTTPTTPPSIPLDESATISSGIVNPFTLATAVTEGPSITHPVVVEYVDADLDPPIIHGIPPTQLLTTAVPHHNWTEKQVTEMIATMLRFAVALGQRAGTGFKSQAWSGTTQHINSKFGLAVTVNQVKNKLNSEKGKLSLCLRMKDLSGWSFNYEINGPCAPQEVATAYINVCLHSFLFHFVLIASLVPQSSREGYCSLPDHSRSTQL